MSSPPTQPRRPGKEKPPRPDVAMSPAMPDVGQPPACDRVDALPPDPADTPEVLAPAEARRQRTDREATPSTAEGIGKGLRVLTLEARLALIERIDRGLEAERAARTPEEEAIDKLLEAYEAEDANWLSVDQDPPADEPSPGARNAPGAGHATVLTEAEIRWNHAHSAEVAHNARLSGGSISPGAREIVDAYDRGEIDADEMIRQVIAWHARQPKA